MLPISSPTSFASSHLGTSFHTLGPSSPTSSITTLKAIDDACKPSSCKSGSAPSYRGPKAVGSMSELCSPVTPSTAAPPYTEVIDIRRDDPPTPLPPTVSYPWVRSHSSYGSPVSPRPFTYPSNDPSHLGFGKLDITNLKP